ncbi:unnamed protein product [Cladocopium goreaui]|uniref:Calcium-dependent protein kinase 1 n=1 Tax=Cladocopium goreaui TaxID=2562237 RepID=A0A9P1DL17_9DINO|nr:unnamed protein product [Cladocopium goreaui]
MTNLEEPLEEEKVDLQSASDRASLLMGQINTRGRYHKPHERNLEQDYEVDRAHVLGSGANGAVWLVKNLRTGRAFAAKTYCLPGISELKCKEIETEVEILLTVDHPHLARMVDAYESKDTLTLIMELLEGGELFDRIISLGHFTERDAAGSIWQMLLAIRYLHGLGIVHRDLKLENWLFEKKGGEDLKLIDFGLSKFWVPSKKMEMRVGTLDYMAPEVLHRNYTSKCDLWSLGVITYTLLVGSFPLAGRDGDTAMLQRIGAGKFSKEREAWLSASPSAKDFVEKLLSVNPSHRLSADEALGHAWIAKREVVAKSYVNKDIVDALCSFSESSAFRRACLSVMAISLSNEERQEVHKAFLEIDKDHSGTITLSELKSVLEDKFHIQDDAVARTFHSLQSPMSCDEEIHYSDFLAAMMSTRISLHDDLLRGAFQRFDVDNSGYLTKQKLKMLLGDSLADDELDEVMNEVDADHDGQISMNEFVEYLHHRRSNEKHLQAAHKAIDKELKRPMRNSKSSGQMPNIPVRERRRSSVIVKKNSTRSTLSTAASNILGKVADCCQPFCCDEMAARILDVRNSFR